MYANNAVRATFNIFIATIEVIIFTNRLEEETILIAVTETAEYSSNRATNANAPDTILFLYSFLLIIIYPP